MLIFIVVHISSPEIVDNWPIYTLFCGQIVDNFEGRCKKSIAYLAKLSTITHFVCV